MAAQLELNSLHKSLADQGFTQVMVHLCIFYTCLFFKLRESCFVSLLIVCVVRARPTSIGMVSVRNTEHVSFNHTQNSLFFFIYKWLTQARRLGEVHGVRTNRPHTGEGPPVRTARPWYVARPW